MDLKKRVAASLVLFYTIIVSFNLSLGNLTSSNVLSWAILCIATLLIGGLLGERAEKNLHHEFQQATSNNFNDEHVNFGSDMNPANGLAMIGGVDLLGNPYGADSSFICVESDIFNYSNDQP